MADSAMEDARQAHLQAVDDLEPEERIKRLLQAMEAEGLQPPSTLMMLTAQLQLVIDLLWPPGTPFRAIYEQLWIAKFEAQLEEHASQARTRKITEGVVPA